MNIDQLINAVLRVREAMPESLRRYGSNVHVRLLPRHQQELEDLGIGYESLLLGAAGLRRLIESKLSTRRATP